MLSFSPRRADSDGTETASGCQTGIIRTGFSAADFRLNRVIRLANTSGY